MHTGVLCVTALLAQSAAFTLQLTELAPVWPGQPRARPMTSASSFGAGSQLRVCVFMCTQARAKERGTHARTHTKSNSIATPAQARL
jgi:hypothetical protein